MLDAFLMFFVVALLLLAGLMVPFEVRVDDPVEEEEEELNTEETPAIAA